MNGAGACPSGSQKMVSWVRPVVACAEAGSLSLASAIGGQSIDCVIGLPSMLAIGIVAPASSTLSPWVRAQVQTLPLYAIPQSPCTSETGVAAAQPASSTSASVTHLAESRGVMDGILLWGRTTGALSRYTVRPISGTRSSGCAA